MKKSTNTNIYKEELMDIYKNPMNKGALKNPSAIGSATNAFCGDDVKIYLKIEKDVIKEAKFEGISCAISTISSELLTEALVGKKPEEALKITKGQLLDMMDLNLTTSRVKCATLVLDALKEALKSYEKN